MRGKHPLLQLRLTPATMYCGMLGVAAVCLVSLFQSDEKLSGDDDEQLINRAYFTLRGGQEIPMGLGRSIF